MKNKTKTYTVWITCIIDVPFNEDDEIEHQWIRSHIPYPVIWHDLIDAACDISEYRITVEIPIRGKYFCHVLEQINKLETLPGTEIEINCPELFDVVKVE